MNKREALIALNMVQGIGGTIYGRIHDSFSHPVEFLQADAEHWAAIHGIGPKIIERLQNVLSNEKHKTEIEQLEDSDSHIVLQDDPQYPSLLLEIHDPPILLYVKGTLKNDKTRLGVVGTRGCTFYGKKQARRLSTMLAYRDITIVSGLARGIDTAAHNGSLQGNGRTEAILGSGLHNIYPKENQELSEEITSSGALISELPLNTPPEGKHFPQRNRIISGMSRGILVVEAPESSGALITANFALEQNREVFALPGNIDSPESVGCNELIQDGAHCVLHADDILNELHQYSGADSSSSPDPTQKQLQFKNEAERSVYDTLENNTPHTIDELVDKLDLKGSKISAILTRLEMRDIISRLPGNRYVRRS